MVREFERWTCPFCHTVYACENEASDCAQNCAEYELITSVVWQCEICKQTYVVERVALECEVKHRESDDVMFQQHVERERVKRLLDAAAVPGQKKLSEVAR